MDSATQLGPTSVGAEFLRRIATERASGELRWIGSDGRAFVLRFSAGRPAAYIAPSGKATSDLETVRKVVRAFALAASGTAQWDGSVDPGPAVGVDTLGEALVAVARAMPEAMAKSVFEVRKSQTVSTTERFDAYVRALATVGGGGLKAPSAGATLADVVAEDPHTLRSWLALAFLGGIQLEPRSTPVVAPPASARATEQVPGPTSAEQSQGEPKAQQKAASAQPRTDAETFGAALARPLPADPEARKAAEGIRAALVATFDKTHYEVLGVAPEAKDDEIRSAYFEQAKKWHLDKFNSLDLGDDQDLAEELFRRITAAEKLLSDEKARSNYDVYLDRKAKGLPTDVNAILEADGLFQQGKNLVKRGRGDQAKPILERAIELNFAEAEYYAYYGYSLYLTGGPAALQEARAQLDKALESRPNMSIAYDFLGRIYRAEDRLEEAEGFLKRSLQIRARNPDAQRELRLVQQRIVKKAQAAAEKPGLLGKLFKK